MSYRSQPQRRTASTPQHGIVQPALLPRETRLEAAFREWHLKHPSIYREFESIARDLYLRGVRHYGAKAIMEVVRYHRVISEQFQGEEWKCNNSYTAYYARELARKDARFSDFFEFRKTAGEGGESGV